MGKSTQEKIVSVRAFAQQIGVSEGAVRKAIKAWNFTVGVQEDGKINTSAALNDPWVKKQMVIKPKAGVSRVKAIEKIEASIKERSSRGACDDEDTDDRDDNFRDIGSIDVEDIANSIRVTKDLKAAEAMRRREILALAIDKKKLQELEGTLVRKDAVEKVLFAFGSELKKALFNMPQRVVRQIMAASTEIEAINILNLELTNILTAFSDFKKDIKPNE